MATRQQPGPPGVQAHAIANNGLGQSRTGLGPKIRRELMIRPPVHLTASKELCPVTPVVGDHAVAVDLQGKRSASPGSTPQLCIASFSRTACFCLPPIRSVPTIKPRSLIAEARTQDHVKRNPHPAAPNRKSCTSTPDRTCHSNSAHSRQGEVGPRTGLTLCNERPIGPSACNRRSGRARP
jgi:hypothetical protein